MFDVFGPKLKSRMRKGSVSVYFKVSYYYQGEEESRQSAKVETKRASRNKELLV